MLKVTENVTYCNPWFDQTATQPLGSILANELDTVDRMQDHTGRVIKDNITHQTDVEHKIILWNPCNMHTEQSKQFIQNNVQSKSFFT